MLLYLIMTKRIKLNPAQAWICASNKRQVWTIIDNKKVQVVGKDLSINRNLFMELSKSEYEYELDSSYKSTTALILSTLAAIILALFSVLFISNQEYGSFFYSSSFCIFFLSHLTVSIFKNETKYKKRVNKYIHTRF